MTKFQLFRLLLRNIRISNRRSPLFDTNRVGLVFAFIGIGLTCIYFIALGTVLGMAAVEDGTNVIFSAMAVILILDFGIRSSLQQTPSMFIKPYLLMPVRRMDVIDCFLLSTFVSPNNLIWLALFLPYVFIILCGGIGFFNGIAVLLVCQLLIFINGLWYLMVRTLVCKSVFWWALPVAVYGIAAGLVSFIGLSSFFDICNDYGYTLLSVAIYILFLFVLFIVNRKLMYRFSYDEIARVDKVKMRNVSQFTFLNRYGLIGEYIKLEIKSTIRNKAIRQRFLQSLILITLFSCLLAYTDVYDGELSRNAWGIYCFTIIGVTNLSWVMGAEGNYIDLLMTHNENIYTLLKAKYYFFCAVIILPAVILLPTVISGRFSILMILAYFFMTSGIEYFALFQLAVYNKMTLPLNSRITGRGNSGNVLQIIMTFAVLILPMALTVSFTSLFGKETGYLILLVIGLLFTVTNSLWLNNVYKRMMKRRYANIEGFHETR